MYEMNFKPSRVCPSNIYVAISDDGSTVEDVQFTGGCNGNGKAVARLVRNRPVDEVVDLLAGNECGRRGTSCADQLTIALRQAQEGVRALA